MLKIAPFYAFLLLLAISCKGPEGPAGPSTLVDIADEPAGTNCSTGGVRISSGIDDNGNGTLEPGEVSMTKFVCDGSNGVSTLMLTTTEAAGANCSAGGTKIEIGKDTNGDGQLGATEIEQARYVCSGVNGVNSLIITTTIAAGTNGCAAGGLKVETGKDVNSNGQLDSTEIALTKFVCNGTSGGAQHELKYKINLLVSGPNSQDPTIRSWLVLYEDFDIANFQDYDSIFYTIEQVNVTNVGGGPNVSGFNLIFDMIDATNPNTTIPGSEISVPTGTNYVSGNARANFPTGKIDLAVCVRSPDSQHAGYASIVTLYLLDKD